MTDFAYEYVKKLNWNDPWHAGSHMSHQLMMLSLNNEISNDIVFLLGTIE